MRHERAFYASTLALIVLPLHAQSAPPRTPVPTIRVLIRSAAESVPLECRGPVEVARPEEVRPLLSWARLPAATLSLSGGKFRLGTTAFDDKALVLRSRDPQSPLRVGERSYAGEIHCVAAERGIQVVNEVDAEQYVRGVVPAEIGAAAPLVAMKVQAIVARTFAVARMGEPNP